MKDYHIGRRQLLLTTAAVALAGALPSVALAAPKVRYDPDARYRLKITEVEYRRTAKGTPLLARIYQPIGPGPWPVILDLHGGGFADKDREAEEPFDRKMAAAGALVVAIDYTLSGEAPYPACIADANYAVRWLKLHAAEWSGDPSRIGVFGSSSGGCIAMLLMMRPNDKRYGVHKLEGHPGIDATVDYVIGRSPLTSPVANYETVQKILNTGLVAKNRLFYQPIEIIHDADPSEILESHEKVMLKPLLVMQGDLDDNVPIESQNRFVKAFRAAGGKCDYEIFEGCDHQWVAIPGPQTDRAHAMARAFIARQVNG